MKILLIGEYSRLHNSLKEGLIALGHEVVILGFQDGFKRFPVDFLLQKKWDSGIQKKIKLLVLKTSLLDITSYSIYKQFIAHSIDFKKYDIIQLINENSFFCNPDFEKKILQKIFSQNKNVFLLSCGNDYINANYYSKITTEKTIFKPYYEGKLKDKEFNNTLKYLSNEFKKLHSFLFSQLKGVIATDFDYVLPLENHPKYLGLIPNPINTDTIYFKSLSVSDKIVIFHGINSENYYKKGNDFFENALKIVLEKYGNIIEIITTRDVPYAKYIESYNQCHILLDQCYANDQGYNALEAMAKGKVVFTGAENVFLEHYNLEEDSVCINAKPDVNYLVEKLSWIIERPEKITEIGQNARHFIEREHNYRIVAEKYMEKWALHR